MKKILVNMAAVALIIAGSADAMAAGPAAGKQKAKKEKAQVAVTAAKPADAVDAAKPMTLVDSVGASYGRFLASQLLRAMTLMEEEDGLKLNPDVVFAAFTEQFKSGEQGDGNALQNTLISQVNRATDEIKRNSPEAVANAAAEAEFIAKLRQNDKVRFTESGLAYLVVTEGKGETFANSRRVDVKYVGKHLDGSVFDQSETPVPMELNSMIKGFAEGIRLMSPGAKYELYIPANLAYGLNGGGRGIIKRNEMLIFEVEAVGETEAPKMENRAE